MKKDLYGERKPIEENTARDMKGQEFKTIYSMFDAFKSKKLSQLPEHYVENCLEQVARAEVNCAMQEYKCKDTEDIETDISFVNSESMEEDGLSSNENMNKMEIILNTARNYKELEDDDPETRFYGCFQAFETVFHEVRHIKQWLLELTNVSSKDALEYAKEDVTMLAQENNNPVEYLYRKEEADARNDAMSRLFKILGLKPKGKMDFLMRETMLPFIPNNIYSGKENQR